MLGRLDNPKHQGYDLIPFDWEESNAILSGTLTWPTGLDRAPCVVMIGGYGSRLRDGSLADPSKPSRPFLEIFSIELAQKGWASLRYDKPGYGKSVAGRNWTNSYAEESRVASSAILAMREHADVTNIVAYGESNGAYLLCHSARAGVKADGYIFTSPFCGMPEELFYYNYRRLWEYANGSPENMKWAMDFMLPQLAMGNCYRQIFEAAQRGDKTFEVSFAHYCQEISLHRRREELASPADAMFGWINKPTLILAGSRDNNVPPEHSERAAAIMRANGNRYVKCRIIPFVDHGFQYPSDNSETAFRDRYTNACFSRPLNKEVFSDMLHWLGKGQLQNPVVLNPLMHRAKRHIEIDPPTDVTPRKVQLVPGVEIVEDIDQLSDLAYIQTLEGDVGPLIFGEKGQSIFIRMPKGIFVEEHFHTDETLIYTCRGQWVLCSEGRRRLMKAGSLFRYGSQVSTGYEVPFDEDVLLLLFRGERTSRHEANFMCYLRAFDQRSRTEYNKGVGEIRTFAEMPQDHSAKVFARDELRLNV